MLLTSAPFMSWTKQFPSVQVEVQVNVMGPTIFSPLASHTRVTEDPAVYAEFSPGSGELVTVTVIGDITVYSGDRLQQYLYGDFTYYNKRFREIYNPSPYCQLK